MRSFLVTVMFVSIAAGAVYGGVITDIGYTLTDLGGGVFVYTYDVTNIGVTEGIEAFTIYFDYGLYENLSIVTASTLSADWDEIKWQPQVFTDPDWGIDGGYDVWAVTSDILPGETVSGFSVSFDWLGGYDELPGTQIYEVYWVDGFDYGGYIDGGETYEIPVSVIPAPGAGVLGLTGLVMVAIGKRRKRS